MSGSNVNIYDTLCSKCILYSFKFIGLGTINFKSIITNNSKRQLVFNNSVLGICYNILLIFLLTMSSYVGVLIVKDYDLLELEIKSLFTVLANFLSIFSAVLILTYFSIEQKKMIAVWNKLIWTEDLSLESRQNSNIGKNDLLSVIILLFCHIIFLLAENILTFNYGDIKETLLLIGCNTSLFIIYSMLTQYTIMIVMIKSLFGVINSNLQKIQMQLVASPNMRFSDDILLQTKIDRLKELHFALSDICQELSDFYCLPMMCSTLVIFLTVLLSIFLVFSRMISDKANFLTSISFFDFVYIFCNYVSFIFLTIYASNTRLEVMFIIFKTFH